MAVTASFNAATGVLSVFGDALGNTVTLSRDAAGNILINGGAVAVIGGTPTVANTALIQAFGLNDDDVITLDEGFGALPAATLFGGADDDDLTGGSSNDQVFGQAGNDTLLGRGGFDFLFGGAGDDVLTGGDADDQVFGEGGNDRMIWNPGDDTDLFEGGAGSDTAEVNGGGGAEVFTVTANGARVRFDRLDPAPFAIDIGTTEELELDMGGGDDSFSATGNLAALISITVDGGAGNDTILGSNGDDTLLGGDGNDFVDGQQGNDRAFLGAGDDTFQWDPGDGSDIVEGQDGTDTMLFNGSAGDEIFEASANGERVRFTRNLGNIVMDLDDVETIDLNALGGTDTLTVNDLSGTDVTELNVSLAGTIGGTAGDGAGRRGDRQRHQCRRGRRRGGCRQLGLGAGAGGADQHHPIRGGQQLAGHQHAGRRRRHHRHHPAGRRHQAHDRFRRGQRHGARQPGCGHVPGRQTATTSCLATTATTSRSSAPATTCSSGTRATATTPSKARTAPTRMLFFGANVAENIDIAANGGRVQFFRDIANVTMDLDDVEVIDFRALGGADNIVVGDLSGTDAAQVDIDLRGPAGGGDGAADTVTVAGTNGDDVIAVAGDAGGVSVTGLQATVNIVFQEAANDRLILNGLGGDDVINATSLEADGIQLTMNGGLGEDIFLGSEGDDLINGGDGNDLALMGAGDDTFVWNPGDDNDIIEGQAGSDTMLFNGANAAENIDIFANGGRVTFFRDVANVTMDLNDVEIIDFNALGGADTIVVNDLAGTDVTEINLNLAAAGGGGDGAADTIVINATEGDDVVLVVGDSGDVTVSGLAATVNITGFEAANDRIIINGLGGDDVIAATGLEAGSIQLTADGGAGNDVILGGEGNDTLLGGDGDDVLLGGGGLDVIDGQGGDDIEIQSLMAFSLQTPQDLFI